MMATITVTRRCADRLRAGHLWVYRSDVEREEGVQAGALVSVVDGRGLPLGSALYSAASQIAARLVSRSAGLARAQYLQEVASRFAAALERRRVLTPVTPESNGLRLCFGEADDLPGILVDRYNDLLVLQLLTQGTAQEDVRAVIADCVRSAFAGEPVTLWERPDPRIRALEDLGAPSTDALLSTHDGGAKAQTVFALNGIRLGYDVGAGQKTGAFLDQRLNYAAAASVVDASGMRGRALDVCTYQGGFALHLARVCRHVTGVDASRAALEAAERNVALNAGLDGETGTLDWMEADAFDYLRHLDEEVRSSRGEQFDVIVLDPPAFAKSKRAAEGAARGYKELNLRAMRLLNAGGTLVTNSCSHHVSLEAFTEIVAAAAVDAGRRVQLLETRGAAPDHPEVLALPETRYLKCLICRVE